MRPIGLEVATDRVSEHDTDTPPRVPVKCDRSWLQRGQLDSVESCGRPERFESVRGTAGGALFAAACRLTSMDAELELPCPSLAPYGGGRLSSQR